MAKPTQNQLIAIEKDNDYRDRVRMGVLTVGFYWKGLNGPQAGASNPGGYTDPGAAQTWFKGRQLAEGLLAVPQNSIDRSYWASRTMVTLKDMDIPGITDGSTTAEIIEALDDMTPTPGFATLCETAYNEETKKILF